MNFTVFASFMIFVVFLVWLQYEIKKHSKYDEKKHKEYLAKEREANISRKKSMDDLVFITIPIDTFPLDVLNDSEQIMEYIDTIRHLSEEKIVNLTGISNTDLKLRYGVANLPLLSRYDQCYTLLARTLQAWATHLYNNGYIAECQTLLEFSIETGTDVSGTYKLLAEIYVDKKDKEKLLSLKEKCQTLNSAMKNPIERMLNEFDL